MINKKFLVLTILLLIFLSTFYYLKISMGEQKNYWNWIYAYGAKYADKSGTMVLTDDGGYLIYGQTYGVAVWDFFTLKINKKGEILWSKIYSAPKGETAVSYGNIANTNDGGFIFTNLSKSFGAGDEDIVIVKLDKNGDIEWSKALVDKEDQGVWDVIQTSDGGFLIGGSSYFKGANNIYLIKLDSKGNWKWGKAFSYKDYWDAGAFILEDKNGNFLVSGRSYRYITGKGWIANPIFIKVDSSGNLIWSRIFNCGDSNDGGDKIIEAIDGGYVVAGWTYSLGSGNEDFLVYKVDENGDLVWIKTYGKENLDEAVYITKTLNGYAIMGHTNSYRNGYDILYLNLDKNGGIIWSKRFGGEKDKDYEARFGSIYETGDGGFVTNTFLNSFGNQGIEIVVLKTDSEGNVKDCPYIKDADVKVKDVTNQIKVEKPSYSSFEFNWEIKDAKFDVKDANFTQTTIWEVVPSKPQNLSPYKDEIVRDSLNLTWEESINSIKHEIQISDDINFNNIIYKKVLSENSLTLPVDMFQNNKKYYWRVRGINNTYTGEWSEIFYFTVSKFLPPSKPKDIKIEQIEEGVKLSWIFSDQGTFPINGYEIYRSENGKDFYSIGKVERNINYFIDNNLEINKIYYYKIKCFDDQNPPNYSEDSEIVSIKIVDNKPPNIKIYYPTDNYLTNQKIINIKGNVSDNISGVKEFKINNNYVNIKSNGDFEKEIALDEGINNIILEAIDNNENKTQVNLKIILDTKPPNISLSIPEEIYTNTLLISGSVKDEEYSGIKNNSIIINGNLVNLTNENTFTYQLNLLEGENNIKIEIEDNAGNKTIKVYKINYVKKITLMLQIGNKIMYVNDSPQEIDVPPQIVEGRTYLPIKYIVEPLGGEISWDGTEKKVTITLKDITIELWIGKNIARVNGVDTPIDSNNPKVVPMIIQGRTMLPVRFVAENLGCDVQWDSTTKTITIIYPKI